MVYCVSSMTPSLIERGDFGLQEFRETVDEPGRGASCAGRERQPSYLVAAIATRI
jgi:hypothetical protein